MELQCAGCDKVGPDLQLHHCRQCGRVEYCSEECRLQHRALHERECIPPVFSHEDRLPSS
eukprot:4451698-Karenia_brevis.AAC.1